MIHIEKIYLKHFSDTHPELSLAAKGQTFVEYLTEINIEPSEKPPWYHNKSKLSKYINSQILNSSTNVCVGKHYGKLGIELDQLLLHPPHNIENLVVELPVDYLPAISKKRLKKIFETHIVMLNDFEEFCTTYGVHRPHIVSILQENNIKPKCLFLVGAPFQMHRQFVDLNIYTIPFEYWLLVTVSAEDFFFNAVIDSEYKEKLINMLQQDASHHCAIPIFKPRKHRVELLTYLDNIGALNECDWSFTYNHKKGFDAFATNPIGAVDSQLTDLSEEEQLFLSKYDFPREFDFEGKWKLSASPYLNPRTLISAEWFNRYKFTLASETYIGNEIDPILGGCASLTEKTFKTILQGSMPIIHGGKGSVEHLENLGFKSQFGNYDSSSLEDIGKILTEINQQPYVNKDMIMYNFDRITTLEFLASLVTTPLNKIADLINSIRR